MGRSNYERIKSRVEALQTENKSLRYVLAREKNNSKTLLKRADYWRSVYEEYNRLKQIERKIFSWMLYLTFGNTDAQTIEDHLKPYDLSPEDIRTLSDRSVNAPVHIRKRALAILFTLYEINILQISKFLLLSPKAIKRYIRKFNEAGLDKLLDSSHKSRKAHLDPKNKEAIFSILHSPPISHGINRTTWTRKLIKKILLTQGNNIGRNAIDKIIGSSPS